MQKLYKIVIVMLVLTLGITQNISQAQNCCVECQADVKSVANQQVLLEKIEILAGTQATNVSTNVYVSYKSGNTEKFWANIAIATAGIAVSTQLNSTPITAGDSKTASAISPLVPLGVSVATLPSIWKNRPRGVPQAGLFIQHRDLSGKLLDTWEQPISDEAKNSAELLTIAIDKPLSEGTLEVYLQNGSKNEVYFWGLQTLSNVLTDDKQTPKIALPKPNKPGISESGCGAGTHDDGWGNCEIDIDVTVSAPSNPSYGTNPYSNLEIVLPSGGSGQPGGGGGSSGSSGGGNTLVDGSPCKNFPAYQRCQEKVAQTYAIVLATWTALVIFSSGYALPNAIITILAAQAAAQLALYNCKVDNCN